MDISAAISEKRLAAAPSPISTGTATPISEWHEPAHPAESTSALLPAPAKPARPSRLRLGTAVAFVLLVQVNGPDGFTWRSSLSHTDTGAGACELFREENGTVRQNLQSSQANPTAAARESDPQQLPQSDLRTLLSRTSAVALKPGFNFAPLHLVNRPRLFNGYRQPCCRPRCILRESAPPELGNRHHGRRFVERAGSDFDAVPDVLGVGE